jgi:hypothetical protein
MSKIESIKKSLKENHQPWTRVANRVIESAGKLATKQSEKEPRFAEQESNRTE